MVTLNIKLDCFEYLIDILARKYNKNIQDFTTLRLIKLLFLVTGVSTTNEDAGLTDIFDNFVAMPYGPVESDIYAAIQRDGLKRYSVSASGCYLKKEEPFHISDESKRSLETAVDYLLEKNPQILSIQPFELVDITHKWSCWRVCYKFALNSGKRSITIPSQMIQNSVKYYQ